MEVHKEFVPDEHLLALAKDFSEKYKTLNVGEYRSNDTKYHISYLDEIRDAGIGQKLNTPARVSHNTGIIELSKNKFNSKRINSDYVFYTILWCIARLNYASDIETDIQTIRYYLQTGRSKKKVLTSLIDLLMKDSFEYNHKRYRQIEKLIREKEQTK